MGYYNFWGKICKNFILYCLKIYEMWLQLSPINDYRIEQNYLVVLNIIGKENGLFVIIP